MYFKYGHVEMTETINLENSQALHNMLIKQIREQFMLDEHILEVIESTPRHTFVPENYKAMAYAEMHIPIAEKQVMMTPNEEARVLNALSINENNSILEIGTGTGYVSALLAKLGRQVLSIDIFEQFTKQAAIKSTAVGINNIEFITADAHLGYGEDNSYDVICISASMPLLPNALLKQLKPGGRLFALIGTAPAISATLITKVNQQDLKQEILFETNLPEMINAVKPEPFIF